MLARIRARPAFRPLAGAAIAVGAGYFAFAYLAAPSFWRHYEHRPAVATKVMLTSTASGLPGDAINVGIEGDETTLICAMTSAGWDPAEATTFRSAAKIVGSVVFGRPYLHAPVSDLFYDGRRQDLAFQKADGRSAKTRHHARFWKTVDADSDGAALWLGSASYDRSVGISRYTGQITHHIAPDIDAERDLLIADLASAGRVDEFYEVSGIGPTLNARNGGGDRYFTDGEVVVSRLEPGCEKTKLNHAAKTTTQSWSVALKSAFFRGVSPMMNWLHSLDSTPSAEEKGRAE